ncbi:unnamed protein product [[Candida] boidinii]|nr:unnamed protein product [[Candida] boidinii]
MKVLLIQIKSVLKSASMENLLMMDWNQRESLANFLLTVSHQPLDKLRYLQIDPIVILKDMIKHFQSVRSGIIYDAMIIFKNILEKYEKRKNNGKASENRGHDTNIPVSNPIIKRDFSSNSNNSNLINDKKTNTVNPLFFAPKTVQKTHQINSNNNNIGSDGSEEFFTSDRMLNSSSKIELGGHRDSQISQLFGPTDSEMKKHSASSMNMDTNVNNRDGICKRGRI